MIYEFPYFNKGKKRESIDATSQRRALFPGNNRPSSPEITPKLTMEAMLSVAHVAT